MTSCPTKPCLFCVHYVTRKRKNSRWRRRNGVSGWLWRIGWWAHGVRLRIFRGIKIFSFLFPTPLLTYSHFYFVCNEQSTLLAHSMVARWAMNYVAFYSWRFLTLSLSFWCCPVVLFRTKMFLWCLFCRFSTSDAGVMRVAWFIFSALRWKRYETPSFALDELKYADVSTLPKRGWLHVFSKPSWRLSFSL